MKLSGRVTIKNDAYQAFLRRETKLTDEIPINQL